MHHFSRLMIAVFILHQVKLSVIGLNEEQSLPFGQFSRAYAIRRGGSLSLRDFLKTAFRDLFTVRRFFHIMTYLIKMPITAKILNENINFNSFTYILLNKSPIYGKNIK